MKLLSGKEWNELQAQLRAQEYTIEGLQDDIRRLQKIVGEGLWTNKLHNPAAEAFRVSLTTVVSAILKAGDTYPVIVPAKEEEVRLAYRSKDAPQA